MDLILLIRYFGRWVDFFGMCICRLFLIVFYKFELIFFYLYDLIYEGKKSCLEVFFNYILFKVVVNEYV